MHWRRKWQPTPVFLPREFQGRGSLVGCHLWGRIESDTTEVTAAAAKHIYFLQKKSHNPTLHFLVVFPSQKTKVELYKYPSPI